MELHCSLYLKNPVIVTPKVDGTHAYIRYNNKYILEVERLGLDFYIIDILGLELSSMKTLLSRLSFLSKLFKKKFVHNIGSEEYDCDDELIIKDKILNSVENVEFIDCCLKDDKSVHNARLCIKPFYNIVTITDKKPDHYTCVTILMHMLYKKFCLIDKYYTTDGMIIYHKALIGSDSKYPIKIKPRNHLTIDLIESDGELVSSDGTIIVHKPSTIIQNNSILKGHIYRVLLSENKLSIRHDKTVPNSLRTINTVLSLSGFIEQSMLKWVDEYDLLITPYYNYHKTDYKKPIVSDGIKNMLKFINDLISRSVYYILDNMIEKHDDKISVFDICAGKCKLGYEILSKYDKESVNEYVGLDIDPFALSRRSTRAERMYKYWIDIEHSYESDHLIYPIRHIIQAEYKGPKLFVLNNCIYYFYLLKDLSDLLNYIKKLAGTSPYKIIVNGIFKQECHDSKISVSVVSLKSGDIEIDNMNTNKWKFKLPWNTAEITQYIITPHELIERCKGYGFKCEINKKTSLYNDVKSSNHSRYVDLHHTLIFSPE
jgi:hypothetical protein